MIAQALGAYAVDGERLRALRLERGLSQFLLADRSGVRQQHVSQLEHRHTQCRLSTVIHLAEVLEVAPGQLLVGCAAAVRVPGPPPPPWLAREAVLTEHLALLQQQVTTCGEALRALKATLAALQATVTHTRTG